MKHNRRMGLIDRIFGTGRDKDAGGHPASTQFSESEPGADDSDDPQGSRNAPRRELVQVVLRDTMRKHGIPSDWIECRILSTVNRVGRPGLHVNFVVREAHDRLLAYVFAFQDSFERELARFEPRSRDWLLSLGWEFQGFKVDALPDPQAWAQSGPAPLAAMAASLPAPPREAFAPTMDPQQDERRKADEDVQRDLQALFAIRDAALAQAGQPQPQPRRGGVDFQPTQPFEDTGAPKG